MEHSRLKKINTFLTFFWVGIVLSFICYVFFNQPDQISQIFSLINIRTIILSLILIIIGKIIMVYLVFMTLKSFGEKRSKKFVWEAYSFADIAKYVPGGIWSIAGRITIYNRGKITPIKGGKILLAETSLLIFMFFVTGLILIVSASLSWFFIILIIAILFLSLHFLLKKCLPQLKIKTQYFTCIMVGFSCVLFGSSFAILLMPISIDWLWIVGQFNIAFTVGQLAIFAPSGIGIREIIIGYLPNVNSSITLDHIIQTAVLHRFVWMIADIIFIVPLITLKIKKLGL